MRVTAVDYEARTYRFENAAGTVGGTLPFPPRWLDLDDDPTEPGIVIHDGNGMSRVPFVLAVD